MTMRMGLFARTALVVLLAVAVAPGLAEAQAPLRSEIPAETLIEAARVALAQGELDDAQLLLEGVEPSDEHIDDLDFLYGTIALARGDWETAIVRFRAMLSRDPTLVRVSLDLALAYFQARQDGRAAYHFRQALGAPDLPAAARDNALRFLDEIRRRKTWSVSMAVALAPDNNINTATRARIVELFGLPAELSEDARQTSGVGLSVNVSGTYEARLSPDLRFRTSVSLATRTYRKRQFNSRTVTLRAGPRFLFEKFDLRPALTGRLQQLGGELYVRAGGLEVSGDWQVAPEWRLSGALSAERLFYETFLGDGHGYGAQLGIARAFGQATTVRVDTALRRESVVSEANSSRQIVVGVSVVRELPRGFVVTVSPSYQVRNYDRAIPIFGPEPRRDRTVTGRISLSNRNFEVFGLMPEITVRHERRNSNLDLYGYTRTVVEFGLVRTF